MKVRVEFEYDSEVMPADLQPVLVKMETKGTINRTGGFPAQGFEHSYSNFGEAFDAVLDNLQNKGIR